jgi:hypothetical protein
LEALSVEKVVEVVEANMPSPNEAWGSTGYLSSTILGYLK